MIVTRELIKSGQTKAGGWTKSQLEIIGVSWPPQKGWADRVCGTHISKEDADMFCNLAKISGSEMLVKP